ncbi:MAG: class I SAM-dependent methyltransferase [Gemmatimonadaceae bacterium]
MIRRRLPELCRHLGIRTLLDLPCGDFHWMATIDLGAVNYIGADFLPEIIEENTRRYAQPRRDFRILDLLASPLPSADLLLCRDCLVHLSFADIARAIANLRSTRITYLLTTTFPQQETNDDIRTGDWRPLNLEAAPFHWPKPQQLVVEECTEANGLFADKSLGLWPVGAILRLLPDDTQA